MVNTSLYSGLSGLRAHQTYIDVIGSNLANVSTVGYRGSRVTFADLLSVTQSAGARPFGDFGGTNPRQLGLGVAIGSIDVNTRQGTFQDTGRGLDVALEGRGFFTLSDGNQTYYSRVGSFGVDADGQLVDLRNGFRVVGANGSPINVPVTDTLPASATTSIDFAGSLPATVTGPLIENIRSATSFLEGTSASQLGNLGGGTVDLSAYAGQTLSVSVNGQSPRQVTIDASRVTNIAAVTPTELQGLFDGLSDVLTITADDTAGTIQFDTLRLGDDATLRFEEAATATGLLAALGLNATQVAGTQRAADGSTDLGRLTSRQEAYVNGDGIRLTGTLPDGTPFSSTFTYGVDGTTVQDLIDFGNGLIPGGEATLSLDASGNLNLTARDAGEASLSLHLGDVSSPSRNVWPTFTVDQNGTGPDTAVASIDVFDSLGRAHAVQLEFTRSEDDSAVWNLRASLPEGGGAVISGDISQIRFGDDGSFNAIGGGTNQFTFRFDGVATDQTVGINLGSAGGFDGVSQIGDQTSVAAIEQDGFTSGTLLDVGFDAAGNLNGIYSNGQAQVIDRLRIAMFQNEGGLLRQADTLFISGPNSDDAIEVTAGTAGAGRVRAGSLENSNVDIAEEFVALIEAQRGFQANSRVITTTDEILAELVNIVN